MLNPEETITSSSTPKVDLSWETFSQKIWFKVFLLLLSGFTIWNFWQRGYRIPMEDMNVDFDIYCRWARHIHQGYPFLFNVRDIQNPCFYYPPFWGLCIIPFTWVSYEHARIAWYGINILSLFLFIGIGFSWFRMNPQPALIWSKLAYVILLLNFTPLFQTLKHGQANLLLLLLLGGALWFYYKNQPILAGILLGIATAIKIVPIVMLCYFLWKREWKCVLAGFITLVGLTLLSIRITGWDTQLKFIQDNQIYYQYVKEHWLYQSNISIYSLLREGQSQHIFPQGISMYFLSLGIAFLITVYLIWRIPRGTRSMLQNGLEYSLILISLFLAVIYTEHHQYLLLLIPYTLAWVYQEKNPSVWSKTLFLVSWLFITLGYYMDDLGLSLQGGFITRYVHTLGMILCWLAILLWIGIRRNAKTI